MLFRNFGGIHQFAVTNAADLERIDDLDLAHWAATSAPTADLCADPTLAQALDPRGTGRVRAEQLVAAREFLFARVRGRDRLADGSSSLFFEEFDDQTAEGRQMRATARRVATETGRGGDGAVHLDDVVAFEAAYATRLANGDGVVPAAAVEDAELAAAIADMLAVVPGRLDASGQPGVGHAELDNFAERAQAWLVWRDGRPAAEVWGPITEVAVAAVDRLDRPMQTWFALCELAQAQAEAGGFGGVHTPRDADWPGLDLAALQEALGRVPLSAPVESGALAADAWIHPRFREQVALVRAASPASAAPAWTRNSWALLQAEVRPWREWLQARPPEPFDQLGADRVRALCDPALLEALGAVARIDADAASEVDALGDLHRTLVLHRSILEIANNFVNFSAVYDTTQVALFDAGSLVLDGRRLEFCLHVADRAAHRRIAEASALCLVYCEVSAAAGGAALFDIAAPVTSGEVGRIAIGRRGLFVDRQGGQFDALVVDIVDNPVSIAEAMRAPFRNAWQTLTDRVQAVAGRVVDPKKGLLGGTLDKQVEPAKAADGKPAEPAKAVVTAPSWQTILVGGGLTFAALSSAVTYAVTSLARMRLSTLLLAVLAVCALVAAVAGVLGWLRLRRRDMSALLEANGWAVNAQMKVTRRVGLYFTRRPPLPVGAKLERPDALAAFTASEDRRRARSLAVWVALWSLSVALYAWLRHLG
ncbi:MAG: hypothetical protein FJ100_02750 [Deltaproteobacteria bacterium]|nr:hypothetical protein [Deltaproteobacteria bacterium]